MSDKVNATYHGADDARAEAERRYPGWQSPGTLDMYRFTGWREAIEWQASRTPVVADDALALLRGEVEQAEADMDARWSVRGSALRDAFRRAVHIVEHAQPAAPVVADVDAIARVLREHGQRGAIWVDRQRCECGWRPVEPGRSFSGQHAQHVAALLRGEPNV